MYFIVDDNTGTIIELVNTKPTKEKKYQLADKYKCPIYIISGVLVSKNNPVTYPKNSKKG